MFQRCIDVYIKSIKESLVKNNSVSVLCRTEKEVVDFSHYLSSYGLKPVHSGTVDTGVSGSFFVAVDELSSSQTIKKPSSLDGLDIISKTLWNTKMVCISTVHKAKGLEFDDINIMNWVEYVFPKYKFGSTFDRNSEEKVNYVGFSRARKGISVFCPIFLICSSAPGQRRDVSSFLSKISRSCFMELSGIEFLMQREQLKVNIGKDLGFREYSKKIQVPVVLQEVEEEEEVIHSE